MAYPSRDQRSCHVGLSCQDALPLLAGTSDGCTDKSFALVMPVWSFDLVLPRPSKDRCRSQIVLQDAPVCLSGDEFHPGYDELYQRNLELVERRMKSG